MPFPKIIFLLVLFVGISISFASTLSNTTSLQVSNTCATTCYGYPQAAYPDCSCTVSITVPIMQNVTTNATTPPVSPAPILPPPVPNVTANVTNVTAPTTNTTNQISDLMKLICLLLTSILPILVFLLFVLAAILYGFSEFFDSETKAKMKKWSQAALYSSIIMLLIYLIAPSVIELLTGTEFCKLCECTPSCPEGQEYNKEKGCCNNPITNICCPPPSRSCSEFCSSMITCPSGCCNSKCECMIPPQCIGPECNYTWTTCLAGYSDCNNDKTSDCNTTNSSNVCFAGICKLGASIIPLNTCKEGWSDCDSNISTSATTPINFTEVGEGCECNTGGGKFTCCGGKCVPTCSNPQKCNSTSICCPGYGCVDSACKPCDEFDCTNTTACDCPTGCGCSGKNSACTSCTNPETCDATHKCCCGYECNDLTNTCKIIPKCENPLFGECPTKPCCNGYGCSNGECKPCPNFVCTNTAKCDCPTGCGCSGTNQNCTSCSNPATCDSTNPCCCGYECNPTTHFCQIIPGRSCPSGSHWDDTKKCCVFDSKPDTCIPSCSAGMEYNVLKGMCCVIGDPTKCCPLGSSWSSARGCCIVSGTNECLCINPIACSTNNLCCVGSGCCDSKCESCAERACKSCSDCCVGCACSAITGRCESCKNPETCSTANSCCCGYKCTAGGICRPTAAETVCIICDQNLCPNGYSDCDNDKSNGCECKTDDGSHFCFNKQCISVH